MYSMLTFHTVSSISVCVSIKDFISSSLQFSSFFKYSTLSLSKSELLLWLTSKFFKTWFRLSEKVINLLSIIKILQFTKLLSTDSRASIFQISWKISSFTVSVRRFWVDCIDSVCIFLSIGTAGCLKTSDGSYWEFSISKFEWFVSVR